MNDMSVMQIARSMTLEREDRRHSMHGQFDMRCGLFEITISFVGTGCLLANQSTATLKITNKK